MSGTKNSTKAAKFPYPGVTVRIGPSDLTGDTIATVAVFNSANAKTGNVVQVYFIPVAEHPIDAIDSGLDTAVCGDCPLKPSNDNVCYVRKYHGPAKVWTTFHNNRYPHYKDLSKADQDKVLSILASKPIRLGAWGDPAADVESSKRLAEIGGRNTLAYTHQWKLFPELKPFAMASVDSAEEYIEAKQAGWRTYRHMPDWLLSSKSKNERLCPNSSHATKCLDCKLCNGTQGYSKRDIVVASIGA